MPQILARDPYSDAPHIKSCPPHCIPLDGNEKQTKKCTSTDNALLLGVGHLFLLFDNSIDQWALSFEPQWVLDVV
jgi:hypothetical protein